MEQLKVVKKQLILDLDKNGAPTGWRWAVDRFVKFGDGSEKVVPDDIPATAEEVTAHVGSAVALQASDIEADRNERNAAIGALTAERDGLAAALRDAEGKLKAIADADAAYDACVKPLLAKPGPAQ